MPTLSLPTLPQAVGSEDVESQNDYVEVSMQYMVPLNGGDKDESSRQRTILRPDSAGSSRSYEQTEEYQDVERFLIAPLSSMPLAPASKPKPAPLNIPKGNFAISLPSLGRSPFNTFGIQSTSFAQTARSVPVGAPSITPWMVSTRQSQLDLGLPTQESVSAFPTTTLQSSALVQFPGAHVHKRRKLLETEPLRDSIEHNFKPLRSNPIVSSPENTPCPPVSPKKQEVMAPLDSLGMQSLNDGVATVDPSPNSTHEVISDGDYSSFQIKTTGSRPSGTVSPHSSPGEDAQMVESPSMLTNDIDPSPFCGALDRRSSGQNDTALQPGSCEREADIAVETSTHHNHIDVGHVSMSQVPGDSGSAGVDVLKRGHNSKQVLPHEMPMVDPPVTKHNGNSIHPQDPAGVNSHQELNLRALFQPFDDRLRQLSKFVQGLGNDLDRYNGLLCKTNKLFGSTQDISKQITRLERKVSLAPLQKGIQNIQSQLSDNSASMALLPVLSNEQRIAFSEHQSASLKQNSVAVEGLKTAMDTCFLRLEKQIESVTSKTLQDKLVHFSEKLTASCTEKLEVIAQSYSLQTKKIDIDEGPRSMHMEVFANASAENREIFSELKGALKALEGIQSNARCLPELVEAVRCFRTTESPNVAVLQASSSVLQQKVDDLSRELAKVQEQGQQLEEEFAIKMRDERQRIIEASLNCEHEATAGRTIFENRLHDLTQERDRLRDQLTAVLRDRSTMQTQSKGHLGNKLMVVKSPIDKIHRLQDISHEAASMNAIEAASIHRKAQENADFTPIRPLDSATASSTFGSGYKATAKMPERPSDSVRLGTAPNTYPDSSEDACQDMLLLDDADEMVPAVASNELFRVFEGMGDRRGPRLREDRRAVVTERSLSLPRRDPDLLSTYESSVDNCVQSSALGEAVASVTGKTTVIRGIHKRLLLDPAANVLNSQHRHSDTGSMRVTEPPILPPKAFSTPNRPNSGTKRAPQAPVNTPQPIVHEGCSLEKPLDVEQSPIQNIPLAEVGINSLDARDTLSNSIIKQYTTPGRPSFSGLGRVNDNFPNRERTRQRAPRMTERRNAHQEVARRRHPALSSDPITGSSSSREVFVKRTPSGIKSLTAKTRSMMTPKNRPTSSSSRLPRAQTVTDAQFAQSIQKAMSRPATSTRSMCASSNVGLNPGL